MIEKPPGAILFTAAGQHYDASCRIIGCLWVGSTTSGDRAMIRGQGKSQNATFWPAQTDVSNTYLGAIWGPPGIQAPDGFRAERLDSGTLYVYISE